MKTITFFILFLSLFVNYFESSVSVPSSSLLSANWEHYHDIGNVDVSESIKIIESLSVKSYWDVLRGEYRVGLRGEDLLHSHPEYVNIKDKQHILVNGKNIIVPNVTHVDYNNLLMHLIGCLQHLYYSQHIPLQEKLNDYQSSINESWSYFRQRYTIMKDRHYKSSKTWNMENDILEQRISNDVLSSTFNHMRSLSMEAILTRERNEVLALFDEFDSRMQELVRGSLDNNTVYEEYYHQLLVFEREVAELEVQSEIEALGAEFKLEEALLMQDYSTYLQTMSFRLSEESRIIKLTESHQKKLLTMKYSYGVESMQTIMGEIFDRVSDLFIKSIIDQPMVVFRTLVWATSIIILFILSLETIKVLYNTYFAESALKKVAFRVRFVNTSYIPMDFIHRQLQSPTIGSDNTRALDAISITPDCSLIVDNSLRMSLDCLLNTYLISLRADLTLPSVLIYGDRGLGKSHLIEAIMMRCRLSYVLIRGFDLISRPNSGYHLQQLLNAIKRKSSPSRPCLVIIDDADRFIQSRGSHLPTTSELITSSDARHGDGPVLSASGRDAHDCFYILLEEMRNPSRSISFVLLSSSTSLQSIDFAILDRMDQFIELSSLTTKQRLDFIIMKTIESLSNLISVDNLDSLQRMKNHSNSEEYEQILKAAEALDQSNSNAGIVSIGVLDSDFYPISEPSNSFDIHRCLATTAAVTAGWSYRDLSKLLSNIRTEGLGSESCQLTTRLWLREVERKHLGNDWHM